MPQEKTNVTMILTAQTFLSSRDQKIVLGLWGVRYQVTDVSRSVAFYSQQLGFRWTNSTHQLLPKSWSMD
jgi:hypothetical protein